MKTLPGMYTVKAGGKAFVNLTFGDAMRKIQAAFEQDKKDSASISRQDFDDDE